MEHSSVYLIRQSRNAKVQKITKFELADRFP